MSAANNSRILSEYFARLEEKLRNQVAPVVAETAVEYFKESFTTKSFDGVAWADVKKPVRRGSLMVRSGALVNSIRPTVVDVNRVVISAGSYKVPYARVHNEGGEIYHAARSETFRRNRHTIGPKSKFFGGMGAFKKGTHTDKIYQGQQYKAYTVKMPKRQFMGHAAELNSRIMTRVKQIFETP